MAEQEMTSRQVTDRAFRQTEAQERKVRRIKEQIKQVRKSELAEYEVEDQATGETKVMTRAEVLSALDARLADACKWRRKLNKDSMAAHMAEVCEQRGGKPASGISIV